MRQSLSKLHSRKFTVLELRARQMRSALTPSEQALWAAINAGKLGVHFRRQVPIGGFIVDFLAPSARLVVEVDGPCHVRRHHADARRDHKLSRLGYRILRLEAVLVQRDLRTALALLRAALRP